ncbi:MAG: hypothetical protein ACO3RE_03855, partial [Ilumatobacteraceae bacterium]
MLTGLRALTNLEHRGATGAEPDTGDGAGILIQVPDRLLRGVIGDHLPPASEYAVGMAFLPPDADVASRARDEIGRIMESEGLNVVAWREVPTDPSSLGATARAAMPRFEHLVVAPGDGRRGIEIDRLAVIARKRVEQELVGELAP